MKRFARLAAGCAALTALATSAAFAQPVALSPTSFVTTSGQSGGQGVAVLTKKDQSGKQDNWKKYLELQPGKADHYAGYRIYQAPAGSAARGALRVLANLAAPESGTQRWAWSVFNWNRNAWDFLGDNAGAPDWKWREYSLTAPLDASNYVKNGTREILVQLASDNAADNADLDYESVVYDAATAPPVAPTPAPVPLPTPSPAPPFSGRWQPAPGLTWQYQLSGLPINQNVDADVFDIDVFENDAATVASLHARGKRVIAYMSAGSWENYRADAAQFPASVLGKTLDGWPDEKWLDIRRIDILGPILEARMDLAKQKGFDAIGFDNVDGYTNANGFSLTPADQLNFNKYLAREAHRRGLAVGLKNDLDQIPDLLPFFDFAINEQCFQYQESDALKPFIAAGKAVFEVEYNLKLSKFSAKAKALRFSSIRKNLKLDAPLETVR